MRHKVAGWKLGRNTAHRRSLLRNLVTSLIVEERIETTIPKAKAMRPRVEKMITLGKSGDLAARRLAAAYLMTSDSVDKLFDTIGPALWRPQGRLPAHRPHRLAEGRWRRQGFVELLGSEKVLDEKRQKRAEARAKRVPKSKQGDGRSRGSGPGTGRRKLRKARAHREGRKVARIRWGEVSTEPQPASKSTSTHPNLGCVSFFRDVGFQRYMYSGI